MQPNFRLRRVVRTIDRQDEQIDLASDEQGQSDFTVLIGVNGTGKSRLLGDIARVFDAVEKGQQKPRSDVDTHASIQLWDTIRVRSAAPLCIKSLTYDMYGESFTIVIREGGLATVEREGQPLPLGKFPHPRRVVALTISQFDKFPLPDVPMGEHDFDESRQTYVYAGTRGRFGRSGSSRMLYTALENLTENVGSTDSRAGNLQSAFEFLGYSPRVSFNYRFRFGRPLLENSRYQSELEKIVGSASGSQNNRRIAKALRLGWTNYDELSSALNGIASTSTPIRPTVDVYVTQAGLRFTNSSLASALVYLRRFGLIYLESVQVERLDRTVIDMLDASSGELSILATFLSLAATIEDGSLILIDEPEISLHPAWQRTYIDLLNRAFGAYSGCHYIIATHSPLIISDLPDNDSRVINLSRKTSQNEDRNFSGEGSDFILATAFDVVNEKNYYLRDVLGRALRLLTQGRIRDAEFLSALHELAHVRPFLEQDSAVRATIDELERVKRTVEAHSN